MLFLLLNRHHNRYKGTIFHTTFLNLLLFGME